ncbi:MAG TPA: alpha-L-arabinofuranosidase C-terminal domain-containing protein [Clostridia bacterium]|nr:alpha-L-arabinofuranosidase C-terminal domain-containing protein [Clostridia bacterium]HPQ47083.1 alpha-L-arabinofuranosidase C-terminal domain-containing protein [Clostridia bacterium]
MNKVTLDVRKTGGIISKYIYGHFAEHLGRCIYDGMWVGRESEIPNINGVREDVIEALRKIRVPVLRWPGGCFADEYHWMDGIGPGRNRKRQVNTHWGMVTETNRFGTHEFMDLCEELGCDAYIAGNLGSGTVREMQDWVDYISCKKGTYMSELRAENGRERPWKLPFFGIGNESWACGGNMTPSYYSDLYKRYQTYVRSYPGNGVRKIACGANENDYNWTDVVMREASSHMWGLSLHYYTRVNNNFTEMGHSFEFGEEEWYRIMKHTYLMDEYIEGHSRIMDKYDPEKKVAMVVDEWGTWYKAMAGTNKRFFHQQNTMRDAVSAAVHFNTFHKHNERVKMANLAQTVNVLQAVILTYDDVMIKTPTYHVFDLYKEHMENTYIDASMETESYRDLPGIDATASMNEETGAVYVSVCNLNPAETSEFMISIEGRDTKPDVRCRILKGSEITSHNTPGQPDNVSIKKFNDFKVSENTIGCTLPPGCVATFEIL